MSDEALVIHCAPTLAGMKTGNLFSSTFSSYIELKKSIRLWNQMLNSKGLRVIPMRINSDRALIYVFRPRMLTSDLENDIAKQLLEERGYSSNAAMPCVIQLIDRLKEADEFPHEIGLFLGYPPEDVLGFITNKAEKYKCSGVWKVYGDEKKATKTFELYRKCTDTYFHHYSNGISIERLAVAV